MAACVPVSAWPHEAGAGARDGAAREAGVGAQAVWLRGGEDPEHGAGLSGLGSQEATRRLRGQTPPGRRRASDLEPPAARGLEEPGGGIFRETAEPRAGGGDGGHYTEAPPTVTTLAAFVSSRDRCLVGLSCHSEV